MTDVHDAATRSRNMSAIRGKDTKPELIIRKALHARGYRYRLHVKRLPGKPDLVFRKYHAVIFVHGCFWHRHDCDSFKWPKTRTAFWKKKINGNKALDKRHYEQLKEQGWRVLVIWECAVRGKNRLPVGKITEKIAAWLESRGKYAEFRG